MNNTIIRVVIIICCIAFSLLFYKNYTEVNKKIESQDFVLDLVNNHDRYHEIYMKQFEGTHSKEESIRIIREVYYYFLLDFLTNKFSLFKSSGTFLILIGLKIDTNLSIFLHL